MKCELISVGTEILLGDIVNTNAAYLSKRLADLGMDVNFQHTVGDNEERLQSTLKLAFEKSDCAVLTGGLGPTPDDLTKEVCARYFGKELYLDEKSYENIKSYYELKKLPMPSSNKKQAMMPKGSLVLENSCGTAPGCIMENGGKIIIILPGPPNEMKPMFKEKVVPYLSRFTQGVIKSHSIRTFGIGESAMAQKVQDLLALSNPTVAPYAKSGEALLRVTAKAKTEEEAEALMKPVIREIENRLGEYIYAVDANSIEEATVALLREKGLCVTFAESCTGGLCAKRLTDIPGSSAVFKGSVVSYSNEVKHALLGVRKEDLEKYGAVSDIVAAQMALGARKAVGADLAAAVTGIAGPESDETGKPVGLIYIAVTDGKLVKITKLFTGHNGADCRDYNRFVSASNAINALRLFASGRTDGACDIREFIKGSSE